MAVLVDLSKVSARTADRNLFCDLSLTVSDGDRLGVVGINGTGKSTLLRLLAGRDGPDSGEVRRRPGSRLGYLSQVPVLAPGRVADALGSGWAGEAALDRLGMGHAGSLETATLSGGQAKRVALAAVLAEPCDLLILDEPTNHLDLGAVSWLEEWLGGFRGGLVLVTHDRFLLDRVTTRILELDRGHHYLHDRGYSSYLDSRATRESEAASAEASRRNLARRELAWLARGAPARTSKPKARIEAALTTLSTRAEPPPRAGELELVFGTPRLGNKVLECVSVCYSYAREDAPVLSGVDLAIGPRERLGLLGANGTGKSTLLDLLAGARSPTTGVIERGPTVTVGYYDQRGAPLEESASVRELVAGPTRAPGAPEDVALMERFWFGGELAFAPVRTLSGGERRRLQLLLVLASRPNVLLLDEPSNDLDLDTLRMLEDFLEEWPGALVVVSHDRTFLERVIERLVILDGSGSLQPVAGGLEAWIRQITASRARRAVTAPRSEPRRPRRGPPGETRPVRASPSPATVGRRLRELEKELSRAERRRDQLAAELHGTLDHEELATIGSALARAEADLELLEEQWFVLAEQAESAR